MHYDIDQMGVASIAAFNDLIAAGPRRFCEDVAEIGIDAIAEREAA